MDLLPVHNNLAVFRGSLNCMSRKNHTSFLRVLSRCLSAIWTSPAVPDLSKPPPLDHMAERQTSPWSFLEECWPYCSFFPFQVGAFFFGKECEGQLLLFVDKQYNISTHKPLFQNIKKPFFKNMLRVVLFSNSWCALLNPSRKTDCILIIFFVH